MPSELMRPLVEHDNAYVRSSAAVAFTEAIERWPASVTETINTLLQLYCEKVVHPFPNINEAKCLSGKDFGPGVRSICALSAFSQNYHAKTNDQGILDERSLGRSDPWQARLAIAQALEHLAPTFGEDVTVSLFNFLVKEEALGDRNAEVRRGMLDAGSAVIDHRGSRHLAELITMFETHLAGPPPTSETADFIQEAVVILFGRVARHLDPSDARLPTILARLVESLKTPSEQVQYAVADCLAPLVNITRSSAPQLANQLLDELSNAPKYAARRGAAYGLTGIVRGVGISAMKEFDVFLRIKNATEDKKQYEPRQGAMFALETLSSTLARLFEPYAIHALPLLLSAFGDSTPDVREAATDAARVIMKNMSGYGVKLMLPSLLSGLEEKQWRTKKGSIELMGMMAYCAPRQLSDTVYCLRWGRKLDPDERR